ncbi:MAG TPA: hypothetical protein VFF27_09915 [Bacteroidia bacterium]|jgi:hypothetical protein|nr:hypothetical protein [Bacteroidia bacterium]
MSFKPSFSFYSIIISISLALLIRFCYWQNNLQNGYNATSWDAFGYYMYEPGFLIYKDVKKLDWLPAIDSTYHVTGGALYQAHKKENGNYVFKYLGGISILQAPFFYVGHLIAYFNQIPQDGFSWPYQYAIMFAAIAWYLIGLIFLRKVLLVYFSDLVTGLVILTLFITTNLPQYVAIDGAMSHSFIFPLYCFVLWLTCKWHQQPSALLAVGIGLTCGLATICRPTEIIMIFIPILWGTATKVDARQKWVLVKQNKGHLLAALIGGCIGVLPQLLYWKYVTGSFVYDVGSKWNFLTPWFRLLIGFYSGWFIYTPVTILFIIGLWCMKNQPFKKSVIAFCLLNIYIVISWSDWKYGVSYSGRALMQASPVYAFALASFLKKYYQDRKWVFTTGLLLLACINFYQIKIYNSGIYSHFSVVEKIVNYFS